MVILLNEFKDSFEVTIDNNESLTSIEKFSYLKGYLTGDAEKCIAGISLSADNYVQAWELLSEWYGNPHLVISSHMDQLWKL